VVESAVRPPLAPSTQPHAVKHLAQWIVRDTGVSLETAAVHVEVVRQSQSSSSHKRHCMVESSASTSVVTSSVRHATRILAKSTVRAIGQSGTSAQTAVVMTAPSPVTGLSPPKPSTVVRNAPSVTRCKFDPARIQNRNHAPSTQCATGPSMETVPAAWTLVKRFRFSSTASGSRSRLPSMVEKNASTVHLMENLRKRDALGKDAQLIAWASGMTTDTAMRTMLPQSMEITSAVEAHKPGIIMSLPQHNMVAKSALSVMVLQTQSRVVTASARSIARGIGLSGLIAARLVVVAVSPENGSSIALHSMVVLNAHMSSTFNTRLVERNAALKIVKAHGAALVSAVKIARTVTVMVQLAQKNASSTFTSLLCAVEHSANTRMVRSTR